MFEYFTFVKFELMSMAFEKFEERVVTFKVWKNAYSIFSLRKHFEMVLKLINASQKSQKYDFSFNLDMLQLYSHCEDLLTV